MESLTQTLLEFFESLPPLLQMILGVTVAVGFLRVFMIVVDFIEDRREKRDNS